MPRRCVVRFEAERSRSWFWNFSSISVRHRVPELFGGPVAVPGRPQRRWRIGESALVGCGSGCRVCREGTSRQWSAHARDHHIHRKQSYSGHGAGGFQKMRRPDATVADMVDILCTQSIYSYGIFVGGVHTLATQYTQESWTTNIFVVKS